MKRHLLFAILALVCRSVLALPVGQWDMHFAYDTVNLVLSTENKVFAVTQERLFSVTPADGTIDTYTRIDGLSADRIQTAAYDRQKKLMLLYYSDADVDIISSQGDIYNLPDIKNSNIAPDKSVNQIYFRNGHAYLSSNFGIINLNLDKLEVADTYILGDNYSKGAVYGFCCDGNYFYALTGNVIKRAPVSGTNLSDYNNWGIFADGLPEDSRNLLMWNGTFVVSSAGKCHYFDAENGSWPVLSDCGDDTGISLQQEDGTLVISCGTSLQICTGTADAPEITTLPYPAYSACTKDGDIWFGAASGLVRCKNDGSLESYLPDGPATNLGQFSYFIDGKVYVCPGLIGMDRGYYPAVLQAYENGRWTNIKAGDSGAAALSPDGWTNDFTSVAIDPYDKNRMFISAWGEGVFEYESGQAIKLHNYETSGGVLHYAADYNNGHVVRVSGLVFDNDGILWLGNCYQNDPLKYMTRDGVWHTAACKINFTAPDYLPRISQLMISSSGLKWIVNNGAPAAIVVIDDGGTYENDSDDSARQFLNFTDQNGNVISPTYCYQIAEDRNGAVWAVTSEGPVIFNNIRNIFDSDYHCSRILIPRNDGSGLADFLLDGVETKAIAVDGANRKWIGTSNAGLYLISADGQRQIGHFTTDNSPLPSNDIQSLCYDKETGELIIVTQAGICSYMTDSTEPVKEFPKDGPIVYPNPVRQDYQGPITIKGLEENSIVRITDSAGNLVYEGTSTGGSLSWDGKNYHGNNVAAGIYYIHCSNSNSDDNRSSAAKVLILR
ncbi:MAG: hypothetical protein IAC32_03400 [Bacteroidetes bacterium]|uniref:Two component regulator propeller n=1 Tax=Candidatus Enterocola intestinipullorum TaxID=2840783 RepID=A0A9D9HE58_9BACT|nr:hypothetical protein [Candidatus Enterocola intestinipullorum]